MTSKRLGRITSIIILLLCAMPVRAADHTSASPAFALRGIKGLWWDGIEKYQLALPWLHAHHMNFLMFCYTSFPASGKDWRSEYTPAEKTGIENLARQADAMGVELCLSFNPGIWSKPPLTYASEADYQIAWKKVQTIHALGVHSFAICLDDINKKLEPADEMRFKTLQAAQVYFVNRLYGDMQSLSPRPRLIFCPSAYTTDEARKHLDYIKAIAGLNQGIDVFWTGPSVCSRAITADDADEFAAWVGRKPIIWDNYPVNDMFPWRPLLAPVKGRSADLGAHVAGLMANPMKQWYASRLPLATLAEYLNDPASYDPEKAQADAIGEYPPADRATLRELMSIYGDAFLGEANYPPKPAPAQLDACKDLRKKLSTEKSLAGLWRDVQPTLDADIAAIEQPAPKQ